MVNNNIFTYYIEVSGWSKEVIKNSLIVIAKRMDLFWIDYINDILNFNTSVIKNITIPEHFKMVPEDIIAQCDAIIYILIKKGETLLKEMHGLGPDFQNIFLKIEELENNDESFGREMAKLRREIALELNRKNYTFKGGLGELNFMLGEMFNILEGRNASPLNPLIEENIHFYVSRKEREIGEKILSYISKVSLENIPLGERIEVCLCLSQHLFSLGKYSIISDYLVDILNTGVGEPLLYYNYFVLAKTVKEYEAALEGYKYAIDVNPIFSLAPSKYNLERILKTNRYYTEFIGVENASQQLFLIKSLINPPREIRENIINIINKNINHAGLVKYYNINDKNKMRICLITEYIEGPTLEEIVKEKGYIQPEEWLQIALQITGTLSYLHDNEIVHGNINPSNIYLNKGEVKVNDFGIYPLSNWPIPISKEDMEYFYYISPEIIKGEKPTPASDVYSLIKTFYYMLTGDIPHALYREKIPNVLWPIFRKGCDENPKSRYQNATELLADLGKVSEAPLSLPAEPKKTDSSTISTDRIVTLEDGGTVILPEKFYYRDGSIYSQLDESEMVLVPEGIFTMGSTERDTEQPVHEVFLGHYLIDKYLVTNSQYAKFLEYIKKSGDHSKCHPNEPPRKDHTPKGWGTLEYKKYSEHDNSPVIFIDWWDAWAYANWVGKTLPTEAQWEKAARGIDSRKYPWGDEEVTPELANYGNNFGRTTRVGSFPKGASPYGCLDMAGNVWEWCLDTYNKFFYRISPKENPVCTENKPARILRGGSWNDRPGSLRTSCRGCWVCIVRYPYIGFRCAKPLY